MDWRAGSLPVSALTGCLSSADAASLSAEPTLCLLAAGGRRAAAGKLPGSSPTSTSILPLKENLDRGSAAVARTTLDGHGCAVRRVLGFAAARKIHWGCFWMCNMSLCCELGSAALTIAR